MAGAREELAWAGGLFEGEGWITHGWNTNQNTGKNKFPRPQVGLGMVARDEAILRRFALALGFGKIYGPYQTKHQPQLRWLANSFEHCQASIAMLWPWLGERRRDQARAMYAFLRENSLGRRN